MDLKKKLIRSMWYSFLSACSSGLHILDLGNLSDGKWYNLLTAFNSYISFHDIHVKMTMADFYSETELPLFLVKYLMTDVIGRTSKKYHNS